MKINQINLVFLVLILFIIVTTIIVVVTYYLKVKQLLSKVTQTINHIIPKLEHSEYKHIEYPDWDTHFEFDRYSNELASFLGTCLLSAYNIAGGYKPRWAHHMRLHQQIGRNGYVVKMREREWIFIYRGTMNREDVWTDFKFAQVPYKDSSSSRPLLAHQGFHDLWTAAQDSFDAVKGELKNGDKVYIVAHSMGCANALFSSLELSEVVGKNNITTYLFAPPRIGNQHLMAEYKERVPNSYALINRQDIIPSIPPNNCSTLSHTYVYDNLPGAVYLDLQTGSMIDNHHVTSYLYAIDESEENRPSTVMWRNEPLTMHPLDR